MALDTSGYSSSESLPQPTQEVKQNFSTVNSEGEQLSQGQVEFFKNFKTMGADLQAALSDPAYAGAYVKRSIDFDDPEILKEFERNGQDAEVYRKKANVEQDLETADTEKDNIRNTPIDINSRTDYHLGTNDIGGELNDSRRTAEVSGTSGKVRIDNERADGNNYLQSRPEKKWANLDKREKERISRSVNMNMVISLQVYSSKLQVKEAMKMIKFNWMETYERAEDRTLAMLEDMAAKARMSQESSQDTNGTTTMSRSENLHDSSSRPNSQSRSIQR